MYQVRLMEIPTDRTGSKCAKLSHLGPDWEWVVGVRLEALDGNTDRLFTPGTSHLKSDLVPRANILLTLTNDTDQIVFSQSGPLNKWTWNWNYGYWNGRGEEYQSAPHTYNFRRFDVGPDEGWGSHFTPRYLTTYSLCYTILELAPTPSGTAVWLTVETYLGSL